MNEPTNVRNLPGAIVTGSSRGIGAAIARRLGSLGYGVCINYVANENAARAVAAEIESTGGRSIVFRGDVADRSTVQTMVDETASAFGGVRIVVNNAGFSQHKTLDELTLDDWNRSIAVNLSAAMFTAQAALPHLKDEPWARIVNICSLRAMTGSDHGSHYATAKSGLIGLTKSLALELAPTITVNAVSPGYTRTDMNATALATREAEIAAKIPANKVAEPEEIAAVVAFLASEEAAYVTGQTINANGGIYM
jgi:3-oxoacyl-[acyl-carrier protein] reductase